MGYGGHPQCQGQAFLLPVFCGDNSVSRVCLSTAGVLQAQRLSAATCEPYGDGLSIYKLPQNSFYAARTKYCDATCVFKQVLFKCFAANSLPLCCQWTRATCLSEGCGPTLGIAKLCGKGGIASQALAVIFYMFNREVPFPESASSMLQLTLCICRRHP